MGFSNRENFRVPEFCENCSLVTGMEQIEVRTSLNDGPSVNTTYWEHEMPADKIIYAHDPNKPSAGAIKIGNDGFTDPFCQCCEYTDSRVLGEAHQKVANCSGPITETVGLFRHRQVQKCGAGFREVGDLVVKLNAGKQDSEWDILIGATQRTPIAQPEQ